MKHKRKSINIKFDVLCEWDDNIQEIMHSEIYDYIKEKIFIDRSKNGVHLFVRNIKSTKHTQKTLQRLFP